MRPATHCPACLSRCLAWCLFFVLACSLAAQDLSPPVFTPPPDPFPPLAGSPGDRAWQELKAQQDYLAGIYREELPDSVVLPEKAKDWPGMNRFGVATALRVLAEARVIVLLSPQGQRQAVWIRSLSGYRKSNGWYGLRVNGVELDEARIYVQYGKHEVNLQTLMTLGSRQVSGDNAFISQP